MDQLKKKLFVSDLFNSIRKIDIDKKSPVVIYSSFIPIFKALNFVEKEIIDQFLDFLIDHYGDRGILMPSFTNGYDKNNICNLDDEKSNSGVLSDTFRKNKKVIRTLSAYFSYLYLGPSKEEILSLSPEYVWGINSVLEWIQNNDATLIMVGLNPTQNSFPHRLEWLNRDSITYRENIKKEGTVIRENKNYFLSEKLFARKNEYNFENNFSKLFNFINKDKIKFKNFNGVLLSCYKSSEIIKSIDPFVKEDPFFLVN